MSHRRSKTEGSSPRPGKARPAAGAAAVEWLIGGISAVLVAGMVIYFAYRSIVADGIPPILTTVVENVERSGADVLIRFTLRNDGGDAAADVTVRATMSPASQPGEVAELRFDYVPAGSIRKGAFILPADPTTAASPHLTIRSYSRP